MLEAVVRRPAISILLFLLMVTLGVTAYRTIPRQEDPAFPIPIYTVVAVLPGATPVDLERLVVKPIEDRVDELERVREVDARITGDLATVRIEFESAVDAERTYDEVVREMNALRPELPGELAVFEVRKTSSLDVSIALLALVSARASDAELDRLAESLADRIAQVPGVRRARRWGEAERQVEVALDLGRLAQLGVPAGAVLQAIGSESLDLPGGAVTTGARRFAVRTSGSYTSPDEVAATVVAGHGAGVLRVGDVATVGWSSADPTYLVRHDGRRAVFVNAEQLAGWRIGDVRDGIWAVLDAFERELPTGVTLARGFDQSVNVQQRLSRLA